MKIPLFSALWCLLRALENFALAAAAVVLSTSAIHAPDMKAWHAEAARCLSRARAGSPSGSVNSATPSPPELFQSLHTHENTALQRPRLGPPHQP